MDWLVVSFDSPVVKNPVRGFTTLCTGVQLIAVGNRAREIMRDPYLLGFEVVDKNEDNSRLIGVFAFRVGKEILMIPVFFLNGVIKGQQLLYQKMKNKFCNSSEARIAFFLAKDTPDAGRGVDRRSHRADARLTLGAEPVYRNSSVYKRAAEILALPEAERAELQTKLAAENPEITEAIELWKQAAPKTLWDEMHRNWQLPELQPLLPDFLADFNKQACRILELNPELAEIVARSGSLDLPKVAREAPPAPRPPRLELRTEPPADLGEEAVSEYFSRNFLLVDRRDPLKLAKVLEAPAEENYETVNEPGVQNLILTDGSRLKVLWGPVIEHEQSSRPGDPIGCPPTVGRTFHGVVLEGEDKGTIFENRDLNPGILSEGVSREPGDEATTAGTEAPKADGLYAVWLEGRGFWQADYRFPILVKKVDKDGDILRINDGVNDYQCPLIVVRKDIALTDAGTAPVGRGAYVLGADARWVKLRKAEEPKDSPSAHVSPVYCSAQLATAEELAAGLKTASVKLIRGRHGLTDIWHHDQCLARELKPAELALKLASGLALPKREVLAIVDSLDVGKHLQLKVAGPGWVEALARKAGYKSAASYFEDPLDPESDEFLDEDYESDLLLPIQQDVARETALRRNQRPSPQRHYLDAKGYGGARNDDITHIPDEVILGMENPQQEMMEMGEQLGLNTLLDHGAVGSMVKIFDGKPWLKQHIEKLEEAEDHLARILFLLWWRPKDFSDMFGDDDLVSLEHKILAVFESYGDLVLDLLQSVGDK
jgi:hypothetical protein